LGVAGCNWKPTPKPILTGVPEGKTYFGEDHRPEEANDREEDRRREQNDSRPPTDDPYVVARPLSPSPAETSPSLTRRDEGFSVQYSSPYRPPSAMTEQELAAEALARIGPPAVPALVQALQHRDPEVRRQALAVLMRMGPDAKEAAGEVTKLLDDPDERIRKMAAKALANIGPEAAVAVPALMRNLLQPSPQAPGEPVQR
jgi:hypothetical protein